ncbi:hypothetical protein ACFE04_016640 [Oxalis oulophora]
MVTTMLSSACLSLASQSTVEVSRAKLVRLVACHQKIKIAFHCLESHIKTSLREAEDVFQSLSIPLMKLVGLKNQEMATEGRFTSIIIDNDSNHREQRTCDVSINSSIFSEDCSFAEDNYYNKASRAGKELIMNQQTQLSKLVRILRQIETQVNSHHNNILENLVNHQAAMRNFLEKAVYFLSSCQGDKQEVFMVSMKLFRITFEKVCSVLGSVGNGVDNLMQDLAKEMCQPIVHYVKGLQADIKQGLCVQLLAMVEEMERSLANGRVQLEEARQNVRIAEEGKIEALCKLKETEERVRKIMDFCGQREQFGAQKCIGTMENDDKLLWKLLKNKRKNKVPDSPMGPRELIYYERKPKIHNSTGKMTRSCYVGNRQVTSPACYSAVMPLGSSPTTVQYKRIRCGCPSYIIFFKKAVVNLPSNQEVGTVFSG